MRTTQSQVLMDLYKGCRSYRRFLQEPVPQEVLMDIAEAVRTASCSRNAQVMRYVIVSDPEMVADIRPFTKWAGALPPEIGMPKEDEYPTAWVAIYYEGTRNHFFDMDAGIAANTVTTVAWAHGIGSCMLGAIDAASIKPLLGIPEDANLNLVVALGKPAHTSTIAEVPEDGKLTYYVDEDRNYYVPKLPLDQVVKFI